MAAGVPPRPEALRLLAHAAACATCGPLLSEAVAELGEGEEASPHRRPHPGWYAPAWALAAAAVILLAVLIIRDSRARRAPEQLLAEAYNQHRTLALRLPGALYAPLALTRGVETEPTPALLEAEDRIAHALERSPRDPHWLDLQARADLLNNRYDDALTHAKAGLQADPHNAPLLNDAAIAYFQRAEAGGNPADYDAALEALGEALAAAPNDAVARFNRALTAERLRLYPLAIRDWQRYLQLDPRGAWAAAAQRHLRADEVLVGKHGRSEAQPLLPPGDYVAALARGDPRASGRSEEYLGAALSTWLPAAYPVPPARADGRARQALAALAQQLRQRHHDAWLDALLASGQAAAALPSAAQFAHAIAALAKADAANRAGAPGPAAAAAHRARTDFAALTPPAQAGEARAELEWAYALDRRDQTAACLTQSNAALAAGKRYGFAAIQADALLDRSDCRVRNNDNARSISDIRQALAVATSARYRSLAMRAESFLATTPQAPGSAQLWRWHLQALARTWAEPLTPMRMYQLYMSMAMRSAELGRPHAARDFARASLLSLDQTPDLATQAMTRRLLALYLTDCGEITAAQTQMGRVQALEARLPHDSATQNFIAINDFALAQADSAQGHIRLAAEQLDAYRRELPRVDDLTYRALPYYELRGHIALAQQQWAVAEQAFQAAIWINHASLAHIHSDADRLAWERANAEPYRGLLEIELARKLAPESSLETWEAGRAAVLSQASWSAPPDAALTSMGMQAVPPPPQTHWVGRALPHLQKVQVLSFALLPHTLVIWLLDQRGVTQRTVPVAAAPVRAAAQAFAAACANPAAAPGQVRAGAQQLYQLLIAPVAAQLDAGDELVIEADSGLARVPFAALQDAQGHYFGGRFALRYSPGLAYAALAHQDVRVSRGSRLLAVGDPALGSEGAAQGFAPLPGAAEEARTIAARFQHPRLLTGTHATVAATLAALPLAAIFLTGLIDNAQRVTLQGVRPPLAAQAVDLGAVDGSVRMPRVEMWLRPAPIQQGALALLIEEQQDPLSADYHHWITPEQYAAQFGANPADLAKLRAWLETYGLQVLEIAPSGLRSPATHARWRWCSCWQTSPWYGANAAGSF